VKTSRTSQHEQLKRWVNEMLRVYRDDTTFTPRSDFRTRLRNSLHQILSVLALLIILAGLIAIRGWFLSGHINPEMQLPSNIGPYSNWKGGNSPVFNCNASAPLLKITKVVSKRCLFTWQQD
jgi:hypothetical protein